MKQVLGKKKDITGKEAGIQPLASLQNIQKTILNAMFDGLVVCSEQSKILFVNRPLCKMFGYRAKDLIGQNLKILMTQHDGEKHRAYVKSYLQTRKGTIMGKPGREFLARHKNGKKLDIEVIVNPFEANGQVLFVGCIRDVTEKKKAKVKREKAERLFKMFAEHSTDLIFLENPQSIITFISPSVVLQLGYRIEETVGNKSWDLVHRDDKKRVYPGWKNDVLVKKQPCQSEFRLLHKDGKYIWFEAVCTPVLNKTGEVENVISVCRDISARKEAEEKLKLITDNSTDIISLRCKKGRLLYITPSFERVLGHSAEAEIGKTVFHLTHPQDRKKAIASWKREVIKNKRTYSTDLKLRHKKGHYLWFERVSDPILDENGEVVAVVTTSRNITEYKKAEAESTRFGEIVEESLNEVYVFGARDLKFIAANKAARKNLGYSLEELKNLTPLDLKPEYTQTSFNKLLKPIRDGETKQVYFETLHKRKDGSLYDVEVFIHISETGTDPVFVAIIEDVTEKKAAQLRLQQANKMEAVGNLTGGIAHDFNNLLTAIQGSLQLMELYEKGLSSQSKECLQIALKSSKRGAELTRKLLAYSRKQILKPSSFDARSLFKDLVPMLRRTIDESVAIETRLPNKPAPINVDASLLENALLNMAVNARDAMPEGGHLIFEVGEVNLGHQTAAKRELEPGTYIVISVSDTGTGIAEPLRDKIFEPFFTSKEIGKGTGLGLSMVYGFVRQSGGFIDLYTEVGLGTTFKMFFKKDTEARSKQQERTQTKKTRTKKEGVILLVEDDAGVREFVAKALAIEGYRILSAKDGPAAKRLISKTPDIDLLITDVVLPKGMNGIEVGKAFTKKFPGRPIIYSSGYTEKLGEKTGLVPKGQALLSKPYDLDVLFDWVHERLE